MARRHGRNLTPITALLLASLGATVVPLPGLLEPLRPDFVALAVLWLCLMSLRSTGLLLAWGAGLAVDALHGMLLGQHALALVVIAYIALKMRLRIRAFPILHQSVVVFGLLALNEFILFWIDGLAGFPVTDWARWLPVLTGALCWPPLTGLYARLPIRG
jgi:rod shape-determining protein MreD